MAKILLVEDEEINAEIVTRYLRMNKHQVLAASDGQAGVRLASVERPDLILMDWKVPNHGDGEKATREILAQPGLERIPIIALTAQCMPDQVAEMYQAGCVDLVVKPIDLQQLLKRITTFLARGTSV